MNTPERIVTEILAVCIMLALSAWLLKLAIHYLLEIWVYLLIIAVIAIAAVIGWRVYKFYHSQGKW